VRSAGIEQLSTPGVGATGVGPCHLRLPNTAKVWARANQVSGHHGRIKCRSGGVPAVRPSVSLVAGTREGTRPGTESSLIGVLFT
jgi:hypothetical protein